MRIIKPIEPMKPMRPIKQALRPNQFNLFNATTQSRPLTFTCEVVFFFTQVCNKLHILLILLKIIDITAYILYIPNTIFLITLTAYDMKRILKYREYRNTGS